MTTSTFSFAILPAPGRRDVRHVRNAEAGIAFHGAVDDVDRIGAQQEVDEWRARALPAVELVLAHIVDELVLLAGIEPGKTAAAIAGLAGAIDRAQRRPISIRERPTHIHDA